MNTQNSNTSPLEQNKIAVMAPHEYEAIANNPVAIWFDPKLYQQCEAVGNLLSRSKVVPEHFQNKPADCFLVAQFAFRNGLDVLGAIQCASIVRGKLCLEGKLVATLINKSPDLIGRLQYEIIAGSDDEPQKLKIKIIGKIKGGKPEGESVEVSWDKAKAKNPVKVKKGNEWVNKEPYEEKVADHWAKAPTQQLCYYGARVWQRRHMPEVLMGIFSKEEIIDGQVIDLNASEYSVETLTNTHAAEGAAKGQAEKKPRAPRTPKAAEPKAEVQAPASGELPLNAAATTPAQPVAATTAEPVEQPTADEVPPLEILFPGDTAPVPMDTEAEALQEIKNFCKSAVAQGRKEDCATLSANNQPVIKRIEAALGISVRDEINKK